MRAGPDAVVLATSAGWRPRVSSWLNGALLADDVPVVDGRVSWASGQQVPERLSLTVPRFSPGWDWLPGVDTEHPLARFGQELWVDLVVTASRSREWVTRLGRFRVQSWESVDDDGAVQVECVGVLQRAADDRLPTPTAPAVLATFESEFRRLMPGGIPVVVDAAVVDRAVPTSFAWDEDRLAALYEIADAWPARVLTDADGVVQVLPPLGEVPDVVLTLTDGEGGVVMAAPQEDTRDGAYNAVVARAADTDGVDRSGVWAEAQVTTGPFAVSRYGVVRRFFASPLITTTSQALASARTILADAQRPSRTIRVQMPPDPRPEIGDGVSVTRGGVTRDGWVMGVEMPLVQGPSPAPMVLTVGLA